VRVRGSVLGVLVLAAAAAGAEPSLRRQVREADLVVIGQLAASEAPAAGGDGGLVLMRGQLAADVVLKGPADLVGVWLQWLDEVDDGRRRDAGAEGGLWSRGAVPARRLKLGERGLWFLSRASLEEPVYACLAEEGFLAAEAPAFAGAVAAVRALLTIREHPTAPTAEGLQLSLEPASQVYPADGPIPVTVRLANVGRFEEGPPAAADEKRTIYRLDGDLLNAYSAAEVQVNGTRPLDMPELKPPEPAKGPAQTVELALGVAQSAVYDLARWVPPEAGLYKLRVISQPPGCPKLTSNWIWICREAAPTNGLALIAQVYRPASAAARVPMLKVSLVNVTEEPIRLSMPDQRLLTEWGAGEIEDDADRPVPWKPAAEKPSGAPHEDILLAGGAMRTVTAPLAALAQFPRPGRYRLRLLCRVPGVGLLVSNEVAFHVLPEAP
jgi:hypothetical protein